MTVIWLIVNFQSESKHMLVNQHLNLICKGFLRTIEINLRKNLRSQLFMNICYNKALIRKKLENYMVFQEIEIKLINQFLQFQTSNNLMGIVLTPKLKCLFKIKIPMYYWRGKHL